MTEYEAHVRYGYSVHWFRRARWKGDGPQFIKTGKGNRRVLYPIDKTDQWFERYGLKQSTSQVITGGYHECK